MIKNIEQNNPGYKKLLWFCGWLLTFWSGSINMIATYAILFSRVSHMTGPASDLSRFLVTDIRMAFYLMLIVFSFIFGAYMSAIVAKYIKFSANLMLSTLPALVSMILILTNNQMIESLGTHIFAMLLPMGMGWQNGATSQSEIGRTTHVTGDITDIGIGIARGDWAKTFYFSVKFLGYVSGGITGLLIMDFSPIIALIISVLGIVIIGMTIGIFDIKNQSIRKKLELSSPPLELKNSIEMTRSQQAS
ncbi:MAG: YoaK family protein [Candidatus Izemoplasmataceae bacterium]|uniref:YoaK family protein n=1 Tax=Liberiplasma polymorphum TaxID=3374570 RepID=UPI003772967B